MKRSIPPALGMPILDDNPENPRFGWWIVAGLLTGCVLILLLFLVPPERVPYRPYFVEPGLAKFDPNTLMDTTSFRDHLGGVR